MERRKRLAYAPDLSRHRAPPANRRAGFFQSTAIASHFVSDARCAGIAAGDVERRGLAAERLLWRWFGDRRFSYVLSRRTLSEDQREFSLASSGRPDAQQHARGPFA